MIEVLTKFFYMNGYGCYVFSAYAIVFIFLSTQIFIPFRRFKHYLRKLNNNNE